MLIVQSMDGGDEAFLAFTADELYAMACAEEGMYAKDSRLFVLHALISYNGPVCRHPSGACI
jgi:hypothetical protein